MFIRLISQNNGTTYQAVLIQSIPPTLMDNYKVSIGKNHQLLLQLPDNQADIGYMSVDGTKYVQITWESGSQFRMTLILDTYSDVMKNYFDQATMDNAVVSLPARINDVNQSVFFCNWEREQLKTIIHDNCLCYAPTDGSVIYLYALKEEYELPAIDGIDGIDHCCYLSENLPSKTYRTLIIVLPGRLWTHKETFKALSTLIEFKNSHNNIFMFMDTDSFEQSRSEWKPDPKYMKKNICKIFNMTFGKDKGSIVTYSPPPHI